MIDFLMFAFFLFWMNVVAFWAYAMDKRYAYYNFRRIPEALLVSLAVAGGAYGAGAAMLLFRHKTRKALFTTMVPIFFVVWLTLFALTYRYVRHF